MVILIEFNICLIKQNMILTMVVMKYVLWIIDWASASTLLSSLSATRNHRNATNLFHPTTTAQKEFPLCLNGVSHRYRAIAPSPSAATRVSLSRCHPPTGCCCMNGSSGSGPEMLLMTVGLAYSHQTKTSNTICTSSSSGPFMAYLVVLIWDLFQCYNALLFNVISAITRARL